MENLVNRGDTSKIVAEGVLTGAISVLPQVVGYVLSDIKSHELTDKGPSCVQHQEYPEC